MICSTKENRREIVSQSRETANSLAKKWGTVIPEVNLNTSSNVLSIVFRAKGIASQAYSAATSFVSKFNKFYAGTDIKMRSFDPKRYKESDVEIKVTLTDNEVDRLSNEVPKQDIQPSITQEQSKNIDDLKSIEPSYAKGTNEQVQAFIESKIPDSKIQNVVFRGAKEVEIKENELVRSGFWFTDTKAAAKKWNITKSYRTPVVLPVIINVKNPKFYDKFWKGYLSVTEAIQARGWNTGDREASETPRLQLKNRLKSEGYDGIFIGEDVWNDEGENLIPGKQYVVFDLSQIISLSSKETIKEWEQFLAKSIPKNFTTISENLESKIKELPNRDEVKVFIDNQILSNPRVTKIEYEETLTIRPYEKDKVISQNLYESLHTRVFSQLAHWYKSESKYYDKLLNILKEVFPNLSENELKVAANYAWTITEAEFEAMEDSYLEHESNRFKGKIEDWKEIINTYNLQNYLNNAPFKDVNYKKINKLESQLDMFAEVINKPFSMSNEIRAGYEDDIVFLTVNREEERQELLDMLSKIDSYEKEGEFNMKLCKL